MTKPTREQRIDWAWGNAALHNPEITKEIVAEMVDQLDAGPLKLVIEVWRGEYLVGTIDLPYSHLRAIQEMVAPDENGLAEGGAYDLTAAHLELLGLDFDVGVVRDD